MADAAQSATKAFSKVSDQRLEPLAPEVALKLDSSSDRPIRFLIFLVDWMLSYLGPFLLPCGILFLDLSHYNLDKLSSVSEVTE